MIIKSIIKEILNKKINNILIITQLVITIILLVYCFDNIRMLNYPKEQLKSILDDKYNNIYQIKISNSSDSDQFANMFNKFDSNLKMNLGDKNLGAYNLSNTHFVQLEDNEKFMNLRRQLTKGTFKELYPQAIEFYSVDYAIYKLMNIKIEDGRGLDSDDFRQIPNQPTPMLVSIVYKGIININDVLRSRLDDKDYKVVGFFNENLNWLDENDPVLNKLVPLNDKIITPYIIDTSGLAAAMKAQTYYLINNDNLPDSTIKNDINSIGKKFNLNVECKSLNDQLLEVTNSNKETIFYGMLVSIFIVIISCFGLSIIMYYSVNLRKREFGIRIMCGGSMNYLKSLIVGEILTLMIISFTIAQLILIKIRKVTTVSDSVVNLYNIKTTIVIFLFMILFTVITALLPVARINKLSPKELIGGIE